MNTARGPVSIEIAAAKKSELEPAVAALIKGLQTSGIPVTAILLQNPRGDPGIVHIVIAARE